MRKGFTLIELLVVIAIITLLSTVFVANYMEVRKKSRDTKRMADLKEIEKALELYRQSQSPPSYPSSLPTPCTEWKENGVVYMKSVPADPIGNCTNGYYYNRPSNLDYILGACMESKSSGENIVDCSTYSIDCSGISSLGKCYVIKP